MSKTKKSLFNFNVKVCLNYLRDRQKKRQKEGQTEGKQKDRQADRRTARQSKGKRDRQTDRRTERQTDRKKNILKYRLTEGETYMYRELKEISCLLIYNHKTKWAISFYCGKINAISPE